MRTINDWTPETTDVILALIAAGFTINSGNNGEDRFDFKNDVPKFVEQLIACDEAHLYVTDPNGKKLSLFIVLGNEPGIIVVDYSVPAKGPDLIESVMDAHYDKWSGRKQPTKSVN